MYWQWSALGALLLRFAILPLCPIPLPFAPGDFSFLLASDTFASGRLTNPTPAMWMHFESIHITVLPTYMSMLPLPAAGAGAGGEQGADRTALVRRARYQRADVLLGSLDAAGVAAAVVGAAGRLHRRAAPGPLQLLGEHVSHAGGSIAALGGGSQACSIQQIAEHISALVTNTPNQGCPVSTLLARQHQPLRGKYIDACRQHGDVDGTEMPHRRRQFWSVFPKRRCPMPAGS